MKRLLTRRQFVATLGTAAAGVGFYTWRIEPTWLEITHRSLPVANLPPALAGKTLVQLSDIHIGPQVDDDYVIRSFAAITALQPDFVVHTGDLVTYAGPATLEQAKPVMAHFPRGKLGTVAILGNHDYGLKWADPKVAAQITRLLTENGCTVLRNATTRLSGLAFVGCDDLWTQQFAPERALAALKPGEAALALCHNPDACDLPEWGNYQGWILAGHTHGGQCKPPFLPAPLLPVKNRRYTQGAFELAGGRQLYINRGLGHLLRVRFNVRPEITVFTLRPV
jgi:predicted MPP superfamily phosphohydrolase